MAGADHIRYYGLSQPPKTMILHRRVFGIRIEVHWFDEAGWRASQAPIALLRTSVKPSDCALFLKEATLLLSLAGEETDWMANASDRFRETTLSALEHYAIEWDEGNAKRRSRFYELFLPFAKSRGLGIPRPEEEGELETVHVRNAQGDVVYAAAFLPVQVAGRYRYRYGMRCGTDKRGDAGKAALFAAMRRAKSKGLEQFDFGGYVLHPKPGSAAEGINRFKARFGGEVETVYFAARSCNPLLTIVLRLFGRFVA